MTREQLTHKEPKGWEERFEALKEQMRHEYNNAEGPRDTFGQIKAFIAQERIEAGREAIRAITINEIQYWKDVFDKKPQRDKYLESDEVAQNFARIEIDKWEAMASSLGIALEDNK